MHRLVALALAGLGLSSLPAAAQDVPDAAGYALCTLTDTGRTPAQIWASPVFEFRAPGNDRTMETLDRLAGEFHRHVAGLGGAGTKDCVGLATRAEAEAFRQEQRAIWDKRMYFVKIGNWHDVAWTPPPSLFTAAAPAEKVTRHFRCYATTTDVPGRFATAMTVSSGVFERSVPGDRAFVAASEQARAYQEEFKVAAQANGIPPQYAQCNPYDTAGEADKAERDYRRLFGGFNTKYTVIGWVSSGNASVPAVPAPAAVGGTVAPSPSPSPSPSPATVMEAPSSATPVPVTRVTPPANVASAPEAMYCIGSVQRSKPSLWLRTPIRRQPTVDASHAALGAILSQLFEAAKTAYPGKWRNDDSHCFDTSQSIPGETMCIANSHGHFVGAQSVVVWCSASCETLEARARDMTRIDGGQAQAFDWPVGS